MSQGMSQGGALPGISFFGELSNKGTISGGGGTGGTQGTIFSWGGPFNPFKQSIPSQINSSKYDFDARTGFDRETNDDPSATHYGHVPYSSGRANTAHWTGTQWIPEHDQLDNRLRTSLDQAYYHFKNAMDQSTTYNNPDPHGINNDSNSQYAKFRSGVTNEYYSRMRNYYKQVQAEGPGRLGRRVTKSDYTSIPTRKYPLQIVRYPKSFYTIMDAERPPVEFDSEYWQYDKEEDENTYQDYLDYTYYKTKERWE